MPSSRSRRPPQSICSSSTGLAIISALIILTAISNIFIFHFFFEGRDDSLTSGSLQIYDISIKKGHPSKQGLTDKGAEIQTSSDQKIQIDEKHHSTSTEKKYQSKQDAAMPKSSSHQVMETNEDHHPIAGLSCKDHGGPDDKASSELIFWSDIPSDSKYKSPFYDEEKYITFEPDAGGWNNIRMSYETILVLAHAMGRTLVLPPEKRMYLLGEGGGNHKKDFSFNDFFHLDSIAIEHPGMNIITMEEFLRRKGISGELKNRKSGQVMQPPNGKIDWNGNKLDPLWSYLRTVGRYPDGWNPTDCIAAIPSSKDPQAVDDLQSMFDDIIAGKYGEIPNPLVDFVDNPVPVDGETVQRMRELMAGRNKICIYDNSLQEEQLLHFKVDKSARMLTHFYAFVFFQDWKQDLWSKRFVRDHIRYIDEIVCAAARIVKAVRERARKNLNQNVKGEFDSFHVRRGDFQYKKVKVDVDVLYSQSKDKLREGGTLYIATDERKKDFFNLLKDHYDVTFLDDYMHLIEGINPNYYGMLDQLVAFKGRVFFGTWFSTLSGYINRMRGYYSVKAKLEGFEKGQLDSYYFFPADKKNQMEKYFPVKKPIYMREFPVSWRGIDKGIDQLE